MTRMFDNRPVGDWAMSLSNQLFGTKEIKLGTSSKPTTDVLLLSLGCGEFEVLRLGDVTGHEFHGNQYGPGSIHGAKTREFLNNDLKKGNNIISVAHRKVFSAANGELVKKHRGIAADGGEHPNKGKKTEELYPQGVTREAVGRFHVGFNYEKNVQAQQGREGLDQDFEKQPMWVSKAHPEGAGQHDADNPQIVKHVDTGREYLQLRPHTDAKGNVRREHEQWRDNATGRVLPAEEVKELKKNLLQGGNSKPKAAEQGGLEKKIPVRAIPLEDIYSLRASRDKGWKKINQASHDEAAAAPAALSRGDLKLAFGKKGAPSRASMNALMAKHDADCDKWDAKGGGQDTSLSHGDLVLEQAGHAFHGNQYAGGEAGAAVGARAAAKRIVERAPGEGKPVLRSDVKPAARQTKSYGRAEKKVVAATSNEEHEQMRILTMNDRDLATRINKIKNKDKLERFVGALKRAGKHDLAKAAGERLVSLSRGENLPLVFSQGAWVLERPATVVMAERMAALAK